jgi:hypothetical protein
MSLIQHLISLHFCTRRSRMYRAWANFSIVIFCNMSHHFMQLEPVCLLTPLLAQRDFEDRLGQQLGDLDASIRRNFDTLLAQHLGAAAASIRQAHAGAHERLEGGLLDLAGMVRRLEARLDRLAEAAPPRRPPESAPQRPSAKGAQPAPLGRGARQQQRWGGSAGAGGQGEAVLGRGPSGGLRAPCETESFSESGWESGGSGQARGHLLGVIDKVRAESLCA